jgi:sigma-B regulation protein RsbU (phosphoserine phosphatase)
VLVDDNRDNLRILYETLDNRGYDLRVAANGEKALEVAKSVRPDLMLLDIMMPVVDGYEVCRQMKADPATSETAVIFLSALDDTQAKVRGLELGAVDFISKPFQAAEVVARVSTHLTVQQLRQQLVRRNKELEEANRRIQDDLAAAASIQKAMLPQEAPNTERLQVAWHYRPCDELAGDCLNIYPLDDHRTCVFVCDVEGHGVRAALRSVSIMHSLMPRGDGSAMLFGTDRGNLYSPKTVAERLNTYFEVRGEHDRMFTLLYGIVDTEAATFTYVSAGHPGPMHVRRGESVKTLESTDPPVGILPGHSFTEHVVECKTGDRLLLYSDCLYEQFNQDEEAFGFPRIESALDSGWALQLPQLVEDLSNQVLSWSGTESLGDDLSILALEWA